MRTVSIILARGGSKGIPRKNLIDFCGKPLLRWTVEQCLNAKRVESVWVSSDNEEILLSAEMFGANVIERPEDISGDKATSESGWLHAVNHIEAETGVVDCVLAPQVTSPLRESKDIDAAIEVFETDSYDSLFSCTLAEDIYFWQRQASGELESINYDWKNRKRRQDHSPQYIENGSFYIFKPEIVRKFNNRFGGKIGMSEMEFWKTFEIDSNDSLQLCKALMSSYLL
ncbi:MAG TPA: acylneuraminate cytidylyltransferase family protein [Sphingobacteriaceae bacterium]